MTLITKSYGASRRHPGLSGPLQHGRTLHVPRGFALVSIVIIMTLLMLIGVGLLSISSITTRNTLQKSQIEEARDNAKLALKLALNALQLSTGPDQRVTAEADILSGQGFAGFSPNPQKKHYVGVYSTESWHERDSSGMMENLKPYDENRNREAFGRWLVSGSPEQVQDLQFAGSSLPSDQSIEMVGPGTVGPVNLNEFVRVPVIELKDEKGASSGRVAWWIGDEGVKAKVNLKPNPDSAQSVWQRRFDHACPPHAGISNIDGMESFISGNVDRREMDALISINQLQLLDGGLLDRNTLQSRYHDLTPHSLGVLSDVARGGLKRDLSIPFELPVLSPQASADWNYPLVAGDEPSDRHDNFNSIWEFSNSGDQNPGWVSVYWPSGYRPDWWANKMGYCFMYPDPSGGRDATGLKKSLRGPTWHMLRNHYRNYKREYESLASTAVERRGWPAPSDSRTWLAQPYQPYSHWHNSVGRHLLSTTYVGVGDGADSLTSPELLDPFYNFGNNNGRPWNNLGLNSMGLAPVFTKISLILSHRSDPYGSVRRIDLVLDAVGTLWNPYNVPIEFEAAFVNLELKGLKWNFTRQGTSGTRELAVDPEERSFGREKQFPFQYFRLGVTTETDPNYPFDSLRPRQLIRLNPGECRTFALNFPQPKPYSWASMAAAPGSFTNNWDGGMSLRFSRDWQAAPGDTYTFEMFPAASGNLSMEAFMGYFQSTRGYHINPFRSNRIGAAFLDLPELSSLHITRPADAFSMTNGRVIKQLNNFTNQKEAICYIEFRRRASDESPYGVLAEFDPRSIVNHSDAMGSSAKGSVPGNWNVNIEAVSDFDLMQAGVGPRNNGFWGSSHNGDGHTQVVAFELPDAPLTNIAGLQHCQTGSNGWDASYAIGNSLPHPMVSLDRVHNQQPSTSGNYTTTYYDMSYLANHGLWDQYYFSGALLNEQSGDMMGSLESMMSDLRDQNTPSPLANQRLVYSPFSFQIDSGVLDEEMTNYRWLARHLMLNGPANINSTRVEAWKAWLSCLKGTDLDLVERTGAMSLASGEGTPLSRASVTGGGNGEHWRGHVRLSDTNIETLANNIVLEVRKRGPFLSVADFINRRLSPDETGEMGALQAALERSNLDTGRDAEKGIPGTIRQGDILASIGSTISARSDTFVIRAYGESSSQNGTDKGIARVWCEAVVQRTPELLQDSGKLLKVRNQDYPGSDPAGTDAFIDNDAVSEISKRLGRHYKVVSFRWMNPSEI